ncbi:uncharacterized protein LOC132738816 [Ruditapes philippinarum]|uniref:uncharacterized protein LOC132738816 n=1 Tax=Ruditapes philippinarum TaxID=129788 RepID=UPI00295AD3D9|nr:uncharacterized protein LOC132738816 [Ruditapes philippinarum]
MCHCENNEQCDNTSGECSSGCAKGWFGPGCQYRDIAVEGASDSYSATDGDPTTCYETQAMDKPVWKIKLNAIETITEIYIITKADKLQYFMNFEVLVRNTTTKKKELCYRHTNIAPKSEKFSVLCDNRIVGNQVKIKLTRSQTQLIICDIKINGGRNLAFKGEVSQVSEHKDCKRTCTAEKAVDGHNNSLAWRECSYTPDEHNPWWEVDLGIDALIRSIQVVTYKDNKHNYDIEIKNSENVSYFIRGVRIAQTSVNISVNAIGRFVKMTKEWGRIGICEIYVYGDCQEDTCGYDCQKSCHCRDATIWDKISTNCSSGCKDRWKGFQCNIDTTTDCESGRYGEKCPTQCSKNCRGNQHGFCRSSDGRCFGGCNAGWKGNKCDQECFAGEYGINCKESCSDYCKGGVAKCDRTYGYCLSGCIPGWNGSRCDKACDEGYYGQNCSTKCSDYCHGGKAYCNKVDGNCKHGCMDGWKGPLCDQACSSGRYGYSCGYKCSQQCDKQECNNIDGRCTSGCIPGWTGEKCGKSVYSFNLKYFIATV